MMMEHSDRMRIAATASALGDDTRLRLLLLLQSAGTTGLTVTDLGERLNLAQPRISTHLAILKEAGLVDARSTGRTRVCRILADRAIPLLEAVKRAAGVESVPPPSAAALKAITLNSPQRRARSCYDHLAGAAGVELLDQFVFDRWLVRSGGPDERPVFELTEVGRRAFERLGIDMESVKNSRRVVACGCLDWTERRPHLAGRLGAAVLESLTAQGYVRRAEGSRGIELVQPLDDWLAQA